MPFASKLNKPGPAKAKPVTFDLECTLKGELFLYIVYLLYLRLFIVRTLQWLCQEIQHYKQTLQQIQRASGRHKEFCYSRQAWMEKRYKGLLC